MFTKEWKDNLRTQILISKLKHSDEAEVLKQATKTLKDVCCAIRDVIFEESVLKDKWATLKDESNDVIRRFRIKNEIDTYSLEDRRQIALGYNLELTQEFLTSLMQDFDSNSPYSKLTDLPERFNIFKLHINETIPQQKSAQKSTGMVKQELFESYITLAENFVTAVDAFKAKADCLNTEEAPNDFATFCTRLTSGVAVLPLRLAGLAIEIVGYCVSIPLYLLTQPIKKIAADRGVPEEKMKVLSKIVNGMARSGMSVSKLANAAMKHAATGLNQTEEVKDIFNKGRG